MVAATAASRAGPSVMASSKRAASAESRWTRTSEALAKRRSRSAPGGRAVHDFVPPARTTQSDLILTWSSGNLRISELVPTCPAGDEDRCTRLSDPIEAPASTPREIRNIATNQRPENRERMKFLIENRSEETASYTFTIVPKSAGCT